jgi:predicted DNA-binding transcriptional regulator YafY
MPPRLRRRVNALQEYTVPAVLSGPTVDAVALSTLAQACRDDERLEFEYRKRDGETARRLVEPHRIVSLGRRWYLVAWDLERHDWRSFRVDRLTAPRLPGARFRQRELPATDAAEFVQAGIASASTQLTVSVTVLASAESVREAAGRWAEIEPLDDASCRLTMHVDSFGWPTMLLGAVDADFTAISPAEFADHLRDVGARFTRSTQSAMAGGDDRA